MKLDNYLNKKEIYEEKIKLINKIIDAKKDIQILKEDDLETIIFKKYIETENIREVSKYINELGFMKKTNSWKGERKYLYKEITDILNSPENVKEDLKEIVEFIMKDAILIKQFKI